MRATTAEREYARWLQHVDASERRRLGALPKSAIDDAFYKELHFGTGGLRGKLGLGPNRLNAYTVRRATQGLARYLKAHFEHAHVAICYDTRHGSVDFAHCAAATLAAHGIGTYLFPRVEPTPLLSFVIRDLGCSAGISITASHNPADYNGYKVYDERGGQITVNAARAIQTCINEVDFFDNALHVDFDEALERGLISWVPDRVLDRYIDATLACSMGIDCSGLHVVYTPLHGVGLECISRVLPDIGVSNLDLVTEQVVPDGDFPTCPYPNPEEPAALELGLNRCRATQAGLLLATDPDADRVGIAVSHGDDYRILSGNDIGILLLDFITQRLIDQGQSLANRIVCTTIVSAPMADDMARECGFELRRTLTGFKYIGEQVNLLDAQNRAGDFLFGFEESYGYLAGTHVRDKDAIVSSMLICELAAYLKQQGLDLCDALDLLHRRYGYWTASQVSVSHEGPQGAQSIARVMAELRANAPTVFAGSRVEHVIDYSDGIDMPVINATGAPQKLPAADVIELRLAEGSRVFFRPSGTEPKIKSYIFAKGASDTEAKRLHALLHTAVQAILKGKRP